ncbi:hypothetical protein [Mycobacterium attenuatum]|nr:hypothetical protein [Mycobacterium attenuatum]
MENVSDVMRVRVRAASLDPLIARIDELVEEDGETVSLDERDVRSVSDE